MQWFLGMRYWYIQKCWRIWRKSRETLYPWAPSQSCIFFIYVRGDVMQWALIFLEARFSVIGHDRSNFILGMICYRGCYQISLSLQMYIQKVQNAQLLYPFWRVDNTLEGPWQFSLLSVCLACWIFNLILDLYINNYVIQLSNKTKSN